MTASEDWAGLLFDNDLTLVFQKHVVKTLDTALELRRICKQAPLAVVFKPKKACELLHECGKHGLVAHAAREGDLLLLQFAVRRGCNTEMVCMAAAGGGHLECLKYAHEHGCEWDEWTCEWAAEGGHLECLKWAHEHDCPWNERTCQYAAWGGHLDIIKWVQEHGCP